MSGQQPSPMPSLDPSLPAVVDDAVEKASDYVAISIRIAVVVVLAVLLRSLVHRAIRRVVERAIETPAVPESLRQRLVDAAPAIAAERRRQRAETIGSVLRSVASFVIFGVAGATVLGELGVDLGPILASAGIVGVAVGFGAQNLVRDFLTGIFMILEDQYGVGDVVDVGEASGTVEAVGLRTTRLRDVEGTVWHIRNGEILRVGNMSQGWSRALLDLPVAFDADVPAVTALVQQVADEVWRDPEFAGKILEEPEVWGVEAIRSDGVVIRLAAKTAPLEQWVVARELRQRMQAAFNAAGIDIAVPRSVVATVPAQGGARTDRQPTHAAAADAESLP